jgi:hypothetical protein
MATFDSIDLDVILSERHNTLAAKIPLPQPDAETGSDSAKTDETYLATLLKPTRRITVTGVKHDTIANIRTFISAIQTRSGTKDNAGSPTTYSYSSDTTNSSYDVLVEDFEWEYEGGDVQNLYYTLKMVEGTMI